MNINIILEQPHYWVVFKPAGLLTETDRSDEPSLETELLKLEQLKRFDKAYVRVIHRLDKWVGGLVLVARRKSAHVAFQQMVEAGQFQKTYHAFVSKPLPHPTGELSHWIARDPSGKKATVSSKKRPDSRLATLKYILLKDNHYEITLKTGRYHQIRAQLAFMGSPIIGDTLYTQRGLPPQNPIKLYAVALGFNDPATGVWQDISFMPY